MTRPMGISVKPTTRSGASQASAAGARGAPWAVALILLLVAATVGLAGCGDQTDGATAGDPQEPGAAPRLLVVTSTPVLYSLTANVAGDAVQVENLLSPGASPHQTSFTPDQARLIADADVLILNGAGLEAWADDLVASSGNDYLEVVVASEGLEFLRPDEPVPVAGGGEGDDHEEPEDVDPHVWLDVRNAQRMVDTIADGLSAVDPAEAEGFRQRAAAYRDRLQALARGDPPS